MIDLNRFEIGDGGFEGCELRIEWALEMNECGMFEKRNVLDGGGGGGEGGRKRLGQRKRRMYDMYAMWYHVGRCG